MTGTRLIDLNAAPVTRGLLGLMLIISSPFVGHPALVCCPAPGANITPGFFLGFICDAWLVCERATGQEVAVCSYAQAKALARSWDFIPE